MSKTFDIIVIGLGGMGSATAYQLAKRGRRVLALEQFAVGHDRGSSHGGTRIIRQAYYEHPDYVPLLRRAYEGWYELEQDQGVHLLTNCPCLSLGRPDSELVSGVLRSAREHSLAVEALSGAQIRQRYPMFQLDDEQVGVLEHGAGFLAVETCVLAHIAAARQRGAEVRYEEPVLSWRADDKGVDVVTARGQYHASRLILTAGPWAGKLLGSLGDRLTVMRQTVLWFQPSNASLFRRDRFPIFIADEESGYFYGLPMIDSAGVKIARHYGAPEQEDVDQIDRAFHSEDEDGVRRYLAKRLPGANGPCGRNSVCVYTLTPDRHFLIDVHPEHSNVIYAAGFSGHGFKFAPIMGEVLADLAEKGQTSWPIAMFRERPTEPEA